MKSFFTFGVVVCLSFCTTGIFSQETRFKLVAGAERSWGTIADIKQDPQGYIWLSTQLKGIQRYDGFNFKSYIHDPRNPNSISDNRVPSIYIDSSGIIWAATYGSGLNKFDPVKNRFVHFRHDPNDQASLANDTVFFVLRDHLNNLWVGTYGGLDLLNETSGKFIHYKNIPGDPSSLSYNKVWCIYEDRQGTLWVGCGSPFFNVGEQPEDGGLNRFDRTTGKFTRYLHDPKDSNSISNNKVRAIYEDSKGNFWIGSVGDGLQMMDRTTGKFTHFYHDPAHPDKLSRPAVRTSTFAFDFISFITEDIEGSLWIGSWLNGINKYDWKTKKITHFGMDFDGEQIVSVKDTATGYRDVTSWRTLASKDGLMWFTTGDGNLYNIDLSKKSSIPYFPIKQPEANSFYYQPDKNVLWIGTLKGLVRKDLNKQTEKTWIHEPGNRNSLCNDSIASIRSDEKGHLWIATQNGLSKFDLQKETFTNYEVLSKSPAEISGNWLRCLFIDKDGDVWVSPREWIVDKLNPETNAFTHYEFRPGNNTQDTTPQVLNIVEDTNKDIWVSGIGGLTRREHSSGKLSGYLQNTAVLSTCIDASGNLWAGANSGLYRYDRANDQFLPFVDPNTGMEINGILHILEDNNQSLWIATNDAIIMINKNRDVLRTYGESFGVHKNIFGLADNFKAENGKLFFGDQGGYYSFFPENLPDSGMGPHINFISLKIGDKDISELANNIGKVPFWQTQEVRLNYNQNSFSIEFLAFDYKNPGPVKYSFMLEGYNNNWNFTGGEHTAYLFNIPAGKYSFRVKAVNAEGNWSEKSLIITIAPPWWRTWWAYASYALLFVFALYTGYRFQKSRLMKAEQERSRVKELLHAKEIEKAYHELKVTQAQLIQSEKMASLGELTAGIAHEIQNPLNFVNNFSEVNAELIEELNHELKLGNQHGAIAIAWDIRENERKINLHGKRADAIVKGMLQHSRNSSGEKTPTDLNALADEYLILAYHSFRGKDQQNTMRNSINVHLETDFATDIGKVEIVPQDIGRVLLNLYNNAFYSVVEKSKMIGVGFKPEVGVSTRRKDGFVEITVRDNGIGIPDKIRDKIFQPFFTTKPAGQGTGLGLSLSYDIIQAHMGKIEVSNLSDEGTEFRIFLPVGV